MSATNWNAKADLETVAKRAGGRRHYNRQRHAKAMSRRWKAVQLLAEVGLNRGWQSELARRLGVHRSTICRDFALFNEAERYGVSTRVIEEEWRLRWRLNKRFTRQAQADVG